MDPGHGELDMPHLAHSLMSCRRAELLLGNLLEDECNPYWFPTEDRDRLAPVCPACPSAYCAGRSVRCERVGPRVAQVPTTPDAG